MIILILIATHRLNLPDGNPLNTIENYIYVALCSHLKICQEKEQSALSLTNKFYILSDFDCV